MGLCRCQLFWIHGSCVHEISWSHSHGSLHRRVATQSYLCVSHRRCVAHQLGTCDLWQSSLVQIFGGCVHECREEPCKQSDTDFSSMCPKSMWSNRKSLNIVHLTECLHVMKMMESHVCTNRLRIHLEIVHPLMKLGNDLSDGVVLLHGSTVKCDVAPSKTRRHPKGFVSHFCS